jgi:hypothetical protein
MRERRASGYDQALSSNEIQKAWESHVNSERLLNQRMDIEPIIVGGGRQNDLIDMVELNQVGAGASFTLEYYIPIWVAEDIQDVTAFGADVLSRTTIWDIGSLGSDLHGGGNNEIGAGGIEGGLGTMDAGQTMDAGGGLSGGGDDIIIQHGNMGGGGSGGYTPPTRVNLYRDYIHTHYPALQTQLDIMNAPQN